MNQIFLFGVTLCLINVVTSIKNNKNSNIPKWKKQACEIPPSQNQYSHYSCDENGDLNCIPGWQGDLCDVPQCRKNCDPQNGYCRKPNECRCKLGYYGENCDKCIPLPGCQHGSCSSPFECICKTGWEGIFCQDPVCRSDCHPKNGYCESANECKCKLGYSGKTCRDCQSLPGCQNGVCQKPFECRCLPGWTGILCQTPICDSICSKQNGFCRKPGECICKVGWMGENCGKCHEYPGCKNGDCRRPWECNCQLGYGGQLCDEELNYCENNPGTCENGGKCTSLIKDEGFFSCECPAGFRGDRCNLLPLNMTSNVTASLKKKVTMFSPLGTSESPDKPILSARTTKGTTTTTEAALMDELEYETEDEAEDIENET